MTSFKHSIIIPLERYKKCEKVLSQTGEDHPTQILMDEKLPPDVKMKLFSNAKIVEQSAPNPLPQNAPRNPLGAIAPTQGGTSASTISVPPPRDAISTATLSKVSTATDASPQLSSVTTQTSPASQPQLPQLSTVTTQTSPASRPQISTLEYTSKSRKKIQHILNLIKEHYHELDYDKNYRVIIDGRRIAQSDIRDILRTLLKETILTRNTDVPVGTLEFYEKCLKLGLEKKFFPVNPSDYYIAKRKQKPQETAFSPTPMKKKLFSPGTPFLTPKQRLLDWEDYHD